MALIDSVELRDVLKVERCGAHSHIHGLGLNEQLEPERISNGMVAQESARRAAGLIVRMARQNLIAGRAVLITGEPGSGKTAIAHAMSQELGGVETPFVSMSASEVFSVDVSKTEVLQQALRKACGVRIHEETEVLEGEVVHIEIDKPAAGASGRMAGKLTMKTTDMETIYDLGQRMIEQINREKIIAGDVVCIDKASGHVRRIGRAYARAKDYDAQGAHVKLVPCPDGEIQKRRKTTHTVSLHDIDVINSRSKGFLALFSGDTGEIRQEVRDTINKRVTEWCDEGKADLVLGVLFIDEVHMLDLQCFSYLNRATEERLAPLVVMATNRAMATVRGTDWKTVHGIPTDLLDRCLIIRTHPYTTDDIADILTVRAQEESIEIDGAGVGILTKIVGMTSLRYAIQLLTIGHMIATKRKSDKVEALDLKKAHTLFYDQKRSMSLLQSYQEHMVGGM